MTIDEAQTKIESVSALFCMKCIRKDCANCGIHKAYQVMNDALEELKWYREQDLVKREDVSRKMYWLDVEELVQQIAKAEPPKENNQ